MKNTNSHSRQRVLKRIRQSLNKPIHGSPSDRHPPTPVHPITDFSELNKETPHHTQRLKHFIHAAIANQCTTQQIGSRQQLPEAISTYLREKPLPSTPSINSPRQIWGWEEFHPLDWVSANIRFQSEKIDRQISTENTIGLTSTTYAIADTGTLLLQSHPSQPLATSLLPETHIAVVHHDQIHHHLSDILSNTLISHIDNPQTVLISGPSRTADIEQTLILGAHGPKYVHLILITNESSPQKPQ